MKSPSKNANIILHMPNTISQCHNIFIFCFEYKQDFGIIILIIDRHSLEISLDSDKVKIDT